MGLTFRCAAADFKIETGWRGSPWPYGSIPGAQKFHRASKVQFFHNGVLTIVVVEVSSRERIRSNPEAA